MCGGVRLDVVRRRLLHVADRVDEDGQGEGFEAAEDVGDLGHRRFDDGQHDALYNQHRRDERVRFEGARGIDCEVHGGLTLERSGVGQQAHAKVGCEQAPARPCGRDSLKALHANLGGIMALVVVGVFNALFGPAAATSSALRTHNLELLGGHATRPSRGRARGVRGRIQVW